MTCSSSSDDSSCKCPGSGQEWESWMLELLCIACLSIASKLDEVFIPSLQDLQMEDEYSFHPTTIQQMELTVLKALKWRLASVTPYSYVELLLWGMDDIRAQLTPRITELVLLALLDTGFLDYGAFAIASSALSCALQELFPSGSNTHYHSILTLSNEQLDEMDKCHKIMEERIASPTTIPWKYKGPANSITLITLKLDCKAIINQSACKSPWRNSNPKRQKRGGEEEVSTERSFHK